MRRFGKTLALASLMAIALGGAGRAHAAPAVHRAGHTVVLSSGRRSGSGRLRLTLARVRVASKLRDSSDIDYSQYAPPGDRFVIAVVRLVALGKAVRARRLVVYAVDARGHRYRPDHAAAIALGSSGRPSLLRPGRRVSESEIFVVPTHVASLQLVCSLTPGGRVARYALQPGK